METKPDPDWELREEARFRHIPFADAEYLQAALACGLMNLSESQRGLLLELLAGGGSDWFTIDDSAPQEFLDLLHFLLTHGLAVQDESEGQPGYRLSLPDRDVAGGRE